ncbi:MAG: recombinase RecQ [Flavobacteriaceae bacterium]|nr:recombinase RecQ [Flavobacteriaceae bacterium]
MKTPLQVLEQFWGHTRFRPFQEEIIESVLHGRDTMALLPTGGGKSICFQIPALLLEGTAVVISPLVALMNDQVAQLQDRQIKAMAITGSLKGEELHRQLDNILFGNYRFLYISPERLQQEAIQQVLKQISISLIAVDEAHCISQWGNDFRPAYRNITVLRELHPLVPIIGLTATATPEVLADTVDSLQLEDPAIFKGSFFRRNLAYKVFYAEDKGYQLQQLLQKKDTPAIIYARSRKQTVELSEQLNTLGFTTTYYHGGLPTHEKKERLEAWQHGSKPIIVATNAFGMGIDKSDVRYVVHVQLPESLESYFQEAGRAGRNGDFSEAILLYNDFDKSLVKKQFIDSLPGAKDLKKIYKKLNAYFRIPYGEGAHTTHPFDFNDFCETYSLPYMLTYNGLQSLDRLGVLQLSKEFGRTSIVRFIVASEQAINYFKEYRKASLIGKTLLRMYSGIFELPTKINIGLIAKKTGQSTAVIIEVLEQMAQQEIIELELYTTDASITFLVPREDEKTINPLSKEVKIHRDRKIAQVKAVLQYIENEKTCRSVQLLRYFGEDAEERCGICSVCAREQTRAGNGEVKMIAAAILEFLEEGPKSSREITENLTFAEAKILHVLTLLLEARKIESNLRNQYHLS